MFRLSCTSAPVSFCLVQYLLIVCCDFLGLLKVLGLHQGADTEAVQRQYNKLKREKKGDEAAVTKIENAHSSLMMRNLTARMQAGQ